VRCSDLPSIYQALAATKHPYTVLAIEGSDDFFREDCAARYVELWTTAFPEGELVRLSGPDLLSRLKGDQGGSLFGTRRLYWVEGGLGGKAKKAEEILSIVQHADGSCFFLFVDSEALPKELTAYAEQTGASFSLPPMKPWDRLPLQVNWIQAYIKKRGKGINPEGATLLAKGYAQDRQGLIGEMEKLLTYCLDEPTITVEHVEQIGIIELQPTLWQLLDGVLAGDAKAVASCLTQSEDLHDIAVLRFMKNQLEKLVTTVEEGTPSRNKSQERQLATVRKRGIPTIVSWINRLKMHEVAIRSGVEDVQEGGALLPLFLSFTHGRS
jgi:DNA polymerase III delta subunit